MGMKSYTISRTCTSGWDFHDVPTKSKEEIIREIFEHLIKTKDHDELLVELISEYGAHDFTDQETCSSCDYWAHEERSINIEEE